MRNFVISTELIPKEERGMWYGYNSSNLSHEALAFLVIVHLHIHKKINDARMKAMFKSLREDKLLRHVKTYHCPINDKWYNGESMFAILCEIYNDHTVPKQDIPLDVLLKYLNLYLNKNKNFCIDWVYFNLVEPLVNNISNRNNLIQLRSFQLEGLDNSTLSYEEADRKYDLSSGYCCDDCSGCRSEYKRNQYEHYYARNQKEDAEKAFKKYLFSQKTDSKFRNKAERLRA